MANMNQPATPRNLRRLLFFAIIVALLVGFAYNRVQHFLLQKHIDAAEQAEASFNFQLAHTEWRECVRRRPSEPKYQLRSARSARRAGDTATAIQELNQLHEMRLDSTPEETLEQSLLLAQLGQLDQVEESLIQQIESGLRHSPLIQEALIHGYIRVYRIPNAMYWAERLAERQPGHAIALIAQGMMFESVGQVEQAEAAYRKVLTYHPEHFSASLHLAHLYDTTNRRTEAKELFETLYVKDPTNQDAALGVARCARLSGDASRAATILDQLLKEHPDFLAAIAERGRAGLALEDLTTAEKYLRTAWNKLPADRELNLNLAVCLYQLGKTQEAEEFTARAKQIDEDLRALAEASRQATDNPNDVVSRHKAGELCLKNGQHQQALRWFHGVLQIDPHHQNTHRSLVALHTQLGQLDLANRHAELAGVR